MGRCQYSQVMFLLCRFGDVPALVCVSLRLLPATITTAVFSLDVVATAGQLKISTDLKTLSFYRSDLKPSDYLFLSVHSRSIRNMAKVLASTMQTGQLFFA